MLAATKTRPIKLAFRPGTPKSVLQDVRQRYARYLVEPKDAAVDFFETEFHKKVSKTLTPALWLKHLREAQGLSQAQLGKELGGIKASRISDWETSQRAISKTAAKALSALFHVPAERFL